MIDERHIELIHADLDGELSGEERAELARVLLANPEARALRDELSRLFGELGRLDDVPPPADLTKSVLSGIPWARPSRRSFGVSGGGWDGRAALRYAAVFVGVLLLGGVFFAPGIRNPGGLDVSELVGTIGDGDTASRQSPIDRADIDLTQVRGTVNSYALGGQLVLELDLQIAEALEVRATHGGQTFQVRLDPNSGSRTERVLWLPDHREEAATPLRFQIYAGGHLLHEGSLRSADAR
jgi:hypothetical protein